MESSDENFAWTDASTDTDKNSLIMAKENGCDDSDSGYSYKKKIQNELFKNKKHIKEESGEKMKSKKRKHTESDNSIVNEPKQKHIKLEPESDLDVQPAKKKFKTSTRDSILEEEEFLNLKVKEEQLVTDRLMKKRKKKYRESSHESTVCTNNLGESQSVVIENSQCENENVVNISELSQADNQSNVKQEPMDSENDRTRKKKAKKKKKEREFIEDMINEDKFSAEETVIEHKPLKVYQSESMTAGKSKKKERNHSLADTDGQKYEDSELSLNRDDHQNSISVIESNNLSFIKGKLEKNSESTDKIISCNSSNSVPQRTPKIADRIRFEDDSMNFSLDEECNDRLEHSNKLKKYLERNNHLKQISPIVQGDTVITDDDEVWILKFPSEVDVKSLKDTNLVLDNKCKLKADNQTYVGVIENYTDNVAILTLDHSKPVIKNITLSGTVHFRKRIPKPHYVDHNTMENNQTNFIPLPETKYRHPLFGANYKKAIKVPKHIAQRLNGFEPESTYVDNENRKKKKKKHKQEVVISENEQETKQECDAVEVRKKRKRKHSYAEESSPTLTKKLAKKIKHDPDSAEAWESEKAIEQQLFNF